MTDASATQLMPAADRQDPRAHQLGDMWLLTIFTILLAIGLPLAASGLAIDFAWCALGLLGLAVIHAGIVAMSGPGGVRLAGTRGLVALHALGVVTTGFIWQRAGGMQNPLFLAVFVLPIIGAMFISRWQSYLTAALSALTAAVVASAQAPELHWYMPALGAALQWLGAGIGRVAGGAVSPFAGFHAPAMYYAVLLQVCVVMLAACAVAVEYLRAVFDRLQAQVSMARGEAQRGQEFWAALVGELPLPALLLDADTHEVICASAATDRWLALAGPAAGRGLFELVHFSYPDAIQALINGRDGVEPLSMVRMGERLLAVEVRVQHLAQGGRRLALVTISDTTETFCVRAALDAAEHAALVVDAAGRVLALNRPACALFSEAKVGAELPRLAAPADAGSAWWDPGLSRRRKMQLTVMRRSYEVTISAVALPGEETRLYVIALRPASAGGVERGATGLFAASGP